MFKILSVLYINLAAIFKIFNLIEFDQYKINEDKL